MASEPIRELIRMGSTLLHPDITIPDLRTAIDQIAAVRPSVPGAIIDRQDGKVTAHWIRHDSVPAGTRDVVFWCHGGGYVAGDPSMLHGIGTALSRQTGSRMFVPVYRYGPEHPYPAALDDVRAAYRWLLDQGHEPARVVVGGDSAGGGLVLALLLALRDAGDPLPAASVTFSPWTDLAITGESLQTRAEFTFGMSEKLMRRAAAAYLAGHDPKDPYASPLYGDWSSMPPMQIQVGDHEVLLSDATRLADRAAAAGVDVQLKVWAEMPHVHQAFVGTAPEADEACAYAAQYIRERLGTAVAA